MITSQVMLKCKYISTSMWLLWGLVARLPFLNLGRKVYEHFPRYHRLARSDN